MTDLATRRADRSELEQELVAAGARIKGTVVACPFHEDKNPSGSIHRDAEGVWRFRCHTATCAFHGDVFDVQARRENRPVGEVLKIARTGSAVLPDEPPREKAKRIFASVADIAASVGRMGKVEAQHTYTNPDSGAVEIVQVRYLDDGKKRFLTHHAVDGGFVLGAPPKPWPIYNRKRVRDAATVIVVEGEKCVHALHGMGIVATTSLSGAENGDKADWSPLAGKDVFLWPDNDAAGHKYAAAVAAQLDHLTPPARVRLLNVTGLGLPDHGDVADFIADGATAEEVWRVLEDGSDPIGAGADLLSRLDDIVSGAWQSIDWPWKCLSRSSKSLFPGTITIIGGDPGSSKSFLLLQAMHFWHRNGIKVDLLELEEDRAFHLHRLFAMLAGTWDVLDDEWGRANPKKICEMYAQYQPEIDAFAPHLHTIEMQQLNYVDSLKWIKQRCEAGAKILGIDPITAVSTGDSRQIEDLGFIVSASRILRDHDARLILVTHPRQTFTKKSTQDDIAGGRAFSRHTQTVLMLHHHNPPEELTCQTSYGPAPFPCNRSIRIAKARNAPGHGWRIGFSLGAEVMFRERGIVVEEPK